MDLPKWLLLKRRQFIELMIIRVGITVNTDIIGSYSKGLPSAVQDILALGIQEFYHKNTAFPYFQNVITTTSR